MKKILTALSVLTFASAAGSLAVTVLNTSSQKNDVLNNKNPQGWLALITGPFLI